MAVLINASTSSGLQLTPDTSGAIAFQNNGSTAATIDSSGNVGIGITPNSQLTIFDASDSTINNFSNGLCVLNLGRYSTDVNSSSISQIKTRGTLASPAAVASNDFIGATNYVAYDGATNRIVSQVLGKVGTYTGSDNVSGEIYFATRPTGAGAALTERMRIDSSGNVLVTNASGLGYGTGAGGTVTQTTSRTNTVTLNKPTGQVTMFTAAGSTSWASFTILNSLLSNTDIVVVSVTGASNTYVVTADVGIGSILVNFISINGTASDTPKVNFAVIKGATA